MRILRGECHFNQTMIRNQEKEIYAPQKKSTQFSKNKYIGSREFCNSTSHLGRICLVKFNGSKAKEVTSYHRLSKPKRQPLTMTVCLLSKAPCLERLLAHKNHSWPQVETRIYDLSLHCQEKCSIPSTAPVRT